MEKQGEIVYVLLEPSGTRLGNWMFQYAAAKAAEPNARIAFLIRNRAEWADVERRRELFPDVEIVDSAPPGAKIRRGLFQEAKNVPLEVVRELFRCPPRVEEYLQKTYGELLKRPNLVSIHVRRGDYLGLPHRHPFVGESYLRLAVATVCASVSAPVFIVCSDDLPWCRAFFTEKNFPGLEFHFAAEDGGVMGDLFLMAKCRHHICSNSTFSWWGAYIGIAGRVGEKVGGESRWTAEDSLKSDASITNRESRATNHDSVTVFPSMWFGLQLRKEKWQGLYFDGCTVLHNGYRPKLLIHALALMAKNACGDVLRALHLRPRRTAE